MWWIKCNTWWWEKREIWEEVVAHNSCWRKIIPMTNTTCDFRNQKFRFFGSKATSLSQVKCTQRKCLKHNSKSSIWVNIIWDFNMKRNTREVRQHLGVKIKMRKLPSESMDGFYKSLLELADNRLLFQPKGNQQIFIPPR